MFCNGSGHRRHNFPCDQISCYNVIRNDLTVLGLIDAYNSINPDSAIRYFCCFLFFFGNYKSHIIIPKFMHTNNL